MLNIDVSKMKPDHLDMRGQEEHLAYMEKNGCEFPVVVNHLKVPFERQSILQTDIKS